MKRDIYCSPFSALSSIVTVRRIAERERTLQEVDKMLAMIVLLARTLLMLQDLAESPEYLHV